jgi:hypothetical protein
VQRQRTSASTGKYVLFHPADSVRILRCRPILTARTLLDRDQVII